MKLTITEEANQQVLLAISSDTSVIFTRIELAGLTAYSTTEILPPADGGVGVYTVINKSDVPGEPTFNTLNIYAKVGSGTEFLFATTGMNVDFSGSEDKKIILTVYLEVSDSENVTFEYSGGDNAYAIALEQGFEGSAQDWLDSLKVSVDSYTQDIRGDTVIHFTDGTDVTIETGEADRVSSEDERVTAESERVSNEQVRQAHYDELIDTGLMEENIAQKLSELVDYTPSFKLVELTGSSPVIDLAEGTIFHQEITGKVEYTFVTDKDSEGFKIILDTGNGAHPVILPNSVIWHEDRIPDLSKLYTTYILEFLTIDGGTNWYGKVVFQFSAFETLIPGYVWMRDDNFSGDKDGDFRYIGTDDKVSMRRVIKGIPVTSYYNMFRGTGVSGVYSLNDNVTDMSGMFRDCKATTLDVSNFDTSNVTNMSSMFNYSSDTTLDLSSFDTSNVTNMSQMFRGYRANTLDLSSFDTSKVTDMSDMFRVSTITTGYARTQADADKFNASSNKPAALNFVVK